MMMLDRDYEERVDDLFYTIEDQVDELNADIDVDSSAGMLTIGFPNGSSVVLSRQVANHEVWVAAKSGGYHLAFCTDHWFCRNTDEDLSSLLNRVFAEQLGSAVSGFNGL
jgi:iron-sulfur cluster assembly protein CyaY